METDEKSIGYTYFHICVFAANTAGHHCVT